MEFQTSHYTKEELTRKGHSYELEPSNTNVRIDYKVSGIGSASCGPDLDPKYRLSEKEFSYGFSVKALSQYSENIKYRLSCLSSSRRLFLYLFSGSV